MEENNNMPKSENFTDEEAIELVDKFRVLVGKYNMKNGYLIQKIFAIPTDDYLRHEIQRDFENVWEELNHSLNATFPNVDYDVVALHRVSGNEFYWSNDVTYFEELLYQHSNQHKDENL